MHAQLGMSTRSGLRVAEVAFLLLLFSGIWFAAADIRSMTFASERRVVGGIALALAGLLLIIATHWGRFG